MKRYLLDVSVIIALFDNIHVHHAVAREWFERETENNLWATCPLVENGVIRILSNPAYPDVTHSLEEIIEILDHLKTHPNHQFFEDNISITDPSYLKADKIRHSKHVTDSYLIALAKHHHAKFVTLDRRINTEAVEGVEDSLIILS